MSVHDPANVAAYEADVAFLRGRGCRCKLIAHPRTANFAVPFTPCELTNEHHGTVCPKRMIDQPLNLDAPVQGR